LPSRSHLKSTIAPSGSADAAALKVTGEPTVTGLGDALNAATGRALLAPSGVSAKFCVSQAGSSCRGRLPAGGPLIMFVPQTSALLLGSGVAAE
jgi:hypothetical protein